MRWFDFLNDLGYFAIAVAALGSLSRTILIHWLNKDVAGYQSKLREAHDIEIEKLRNDLRIRSIEHEIRFRSIHEKQAEVIAETYSRLNILHTSVSSYVSIIGRGGGPSKEECLEAATAANKDFTTYFFPRKIFFPKETGQKVKTLSSKLADAANLMTSGLTSEKIKTGGFRDYWGSANDILDEHVPPLLDQLQLDFQKLLGVVALPHKDEELNNDKGIP